LTVRSGGIVHVSSLIAALLPKKTQKADADFGGQRYVKQVEFPD